MSIANLHRPLVRFVMRAGAAVVLVAWASHLIAADSSASSQRFCSDWRFTKGDVAGAEAASFDDSQWTAVRLPHDWAIAGPFDPEADGSAAKLPWKGVGWYRKEFSLERPEGSRVYLDFDGVMAFPKVYVNGKLAGEWDYGYTSFRVDATPFVNLHGKNIVAVRVDTTNHVTRWYPGAGIYRKVMLEIRGPVHVAHWGAYVTTPEVTDAEARLKVELAVENHNAAAADGEMTFIVLDPDGKQVARATAAQSLQPGDNHLAQTLNIPNPRRWDVDNPQLYSLRTEVRAAAALADQCPTSFGVRTIEFTANDGFHLNGRRVQLHGVDLHHDQGPLGAAFNVRAAERQLEIMKEFGVNALRTSHNAPAPEVLDLCDRMGIVVWDECFDKWNATSDRVNGQPSHQEHAERHLRSLVTRDRNHPSVVIWSIGNEIPADREGVNPERVKMMADVVRKYDATRPVGMGCSNPEQVRAGTFDGLDLTGWNYARRYANYRERNPDRPIVYSESASALSTRGFYELPLPTSKTDFSKQGQVNSYDFNAAPWSDIADSEFRLMAQDRFVAGEFVWTGFDYLGEPTPFEKQAKSSYFGIVDLVGIPKDRYWLYKSYWRPDVTTVHILPHWNWPDRVGQPVPVFVYTSGDSAELFLNGRSLGRRTKGVTPERPANLAAQRRIAASSSQPNDSADLAVDGDPATRWSADGGGRDAWLQVDLGDSQPIKCVVLQFPREAKNYGYAIQASDDGREWRTAVTQPASDTPRFGGPNTAVHDIDDRARYVRLKFEELRGRAAAGVCELGVYGDHTEAWYYDPIYDYRLRWNDVAYEPGELKAVAYQDGKEIGSALMQTAGPPAALRLTPDHARLAASGDDLSYVLVEAIDKDGVDCPLADNLVHFHLDGPCDIAGVGNGNPLSLEPFQASQVKLFYGKAMLILRTREGEVGDVHVSADSSGVSGEATVAVAKASALVDGTKILTSTDASTDRPIEYLGADVSALAGGRSDRPGAARPETYQDGGQTDGEIAIMKKHGWNAFRLRVFVSPVRQAPDNNLENTIELAREIKAVGATFMLDIHYSDTWADPQHQETPVAWRDLDADALAKKVEEYSADVITQFKAAGVMPDMVQVGNEITGGMLWPLGHVKVPPSDVKTDAGPIQPLPDPYDDDVQWRNFISFLKSGVRGVRAASGDRSVQIVIHTDCGGDWPTTKWFFDHLAEANVDFDVIGQSFYPNWHGTLALLQANMAQCDRRYHKPFLVAETGYSQSGGDAIKERKYMAWPGTQQGQLQFLADLVNTTRRALGGLGVFYWAPEGRRGNGLWTDGGSPTPALMVLDKLDEVSKNPSSQLPANLR